MRLQTTVAVPLLSHPLPGACWPRPGELGHLLFISVHSQSKAQSLGTWAQGGLSKSHGLGLSGHPCWCHFLHPEALGLLPRFSLSLSPHPPRFLFLSCFSQRLSSCPQHQSSNLCIRKCTLCPPHCDGWAELQGGALTSDQFLCFCRGSHHLLPSYNVLSLLHHHPLEH